MASPSLENLAASEAEIKDLVDQDKREEAGQLLFGLIASCAQSGDLNNANRLRDWFYDVNPMALNDIIKANEIIEEAMSGSVNDEFMQAWNDLKLLLSEEEFSALYHLLEEHQVGEGKQIVNAGSKLDAIFLVTKGNVNVICHCADKQVPIKVLEPGTMIGENCFESGCWTVSLVSLSPVTLFVLRQEPLLEFYERFPGVEAKFTGFYDKFNDVKKLLTDQGLDRRTSERFHVDHKIVFQGMDKEGRVSERTLRGELDTLSRGGLSFFIRVVKREKRRMLFGRRLLITVPVEEQKMEFTGSVVAITIQDFQEHDYAVHVAFDKLVQEEVITPLLPPVQDEEPWTPDELPDTDDGSEPGDDEDEG